MLNELFRYISVYKMWLNVGLLYQGYSYVRPRHESIKNNK